MFYSIFNFIKNYNSIAMQIINFENVLAITPQVEGQALARSKNYITGVMIRGARWTDLPTKKLLWKSLSKEAKANYKNKKQILIGNRLARKLHVSIGDKITLLSANGVVTALGLIPQKQSFVIGGFFNVGMYEYDENSFADVNLSELFWLDMNGNDGAYRKLDESTALNLKTRQVVDVEKSFKVYTRN